MVELPIRPFTLLLLTAHFLPLLLHRRLDPAAAHTDSHVHLIFRSVMT